MEKSFMPHFKEMGELFDHQLQGLKWSLAHVYQGSPVYREKFQKAGVTPQDISSLEDL